MINEGSVIIYVLFLSNTIYLEVKKARTFKLRIPPLDVIVFSIMCATGIVLYCLNMRETLTHVIMIVFSMLIMLIHKVYKKWFVKADK